MAIRSEAQKRAVAKYNAANYDTIYLRVPKGEKELIQIHAESRGESVNAFISRAVNEAMDREGITATCGGEKPIKIRPKKTESEAENDDNV